MLRDEVAARRAKGEQNLVIKRGEIVTAIKHTQGVAPNQAQTGARRPLLSENETGEVDSQASPVSSDPVGHPLVPGSSKTGQLETQSVWAEGEPRSPVGAACHSPAAAESTEPPAMDRENEQLAATDGNWRAQQS